MINVVDGQPAYGFVKNDEQLLISKKKKKRILILKINVKCRGGKSIVVECG